MDCCPPEISRDIVSYASLGPTSESSGVLKAVALACTSWTAVAQEELFRSIVLKHSASATLQDLIDVFTIKPHLSNHVEKLRIEGTRFQGVDSPPARYNSLLPYFTRVTHLTLSDVDWRDVQDIMQITHFSSNFNTVVHLTLQRCCFRSVHQLGILLIQMKSTLQSIEIDEGERFLYDYQPPSTSEHHSVCAVSHVPWRIASLSVSGPQSQLLEWLTLGDAGASLQRMTMILTDVYEISDGLRLLVAASNLNERSDLQSLTLDFSLMKNSYSSFRVSLWFLSSLTTIRFRGIASLMEDCDLVISALASLPSPSTLCKLELEINHSRGNVQLNIHSHMLVDLDTLVTSTQFPHMELVTLETSHIGNFTDAKLISELLPRISQRNILRWRTSTSQDRDE